MTQKPLDRRQKRTRRLLRDALLALIVEKGYDDLTISEITERADLRRATFYLHYANLEEFLLATLRDLFDELAQELAAARPAQPFWVRSNPPHIQPVFDYLAQNRDLYSALLTGASGALVQRTIRNYLAAIKHKDLAQLQHKDLPMPAPVIAQAVAGLETSMIVWWLEQAEPLPPQEIAVMLQTLMLDGMGYLATIKQEDIA